MSKPFRGIIDIFLEGALRVFVAQGAEAIAVKETDVVEVARVGQAVLRDDDVPLAFARFVKEGGNLAAVVCAPDINHPRTELAQKRVAHVQELLRGPDVNLLGHAVGIDDGRPKRADFR